MSASLARVGLKAVHYEYRFTDPNEPLRPGDEVITDSALEEMWALRLQGHLKAVQTAAGTDPTKIKPGIRRLVSDLEASTFTSVRTRLVRRVVT